VTERLAIGIGCRRNCGGEAVAALVRRALKMVEAEGIGLTSPTKGSLGNCCHPRRAATGDSVPSSQDRERWRRGKGIQEVLVHLDSLPLASDCVRGSAGNDMTGAGTPRLFTSQAKAGERSLV
jgi:hypothetical protein